MKNKLIDKLIDLSTYYGRVEYEADNYVFEYTEATEGSSKTITKESAEAFDRLQETKMNLKAQIKILKEVLLEILDGRE